MSTSTGKWVLWLLHSSISKVNESLNIAIHKIPNVFALLHNIHTFLDQTQKICSSNIPNTMGKSYGSIDNVTHYTSRSKHKSSKCVYEKIHCHNAWVYLSYSDHHCFHILAYASSLSNGIFELTIRWCNLPLLSYDIHTQLTIFSDNN